jgi:hypothetical protein
MAPYHLVGITRPGTNQPAAATAAAAGACVMGRRPLHLPGAQEVP